MSRSPEKILVRGVNWLGDAVMTTPALQRLREARPQARITLLTPAKLAGLWQHHPDIDAVMTFADGESVFGVARRLRAEKFDTALVLPNSTRSALEGFLARVPRRIGCARPWRNFFLTHCVPPRADEVKMHKRSVAEVQSLVRGDDACSPQSDRAGYNPGAHHLHHYLQLVTALGGDPAPVTPRLDVRPEEMAEARAKFGMREGIAWFGLNPGAEYGPAKRWPEEKFIAAARELQQHTGCGWVIFGGPADQPLAENIAGALTEHTASHTAPAVLNLAGRTTLRELCAALKACAVLLTNDTGPMHVAAAVGTPVVALFGSTSPELTGPGLPGDPRHALLKGEAPCVPCFRRECPIDFRCLNGLEVERVVAAVTKAARLP